MEKNNEIKVLDCTLRDGGYYTNWDYSDDLVSAYIDAMSFSGVDFVEIGLRSTPQKKYLGAYAYCSDEFLETLPLSDVGFELGVMVNAKDYIECPEGIENGIRKYFKKKSESPVSLVRVAAHFHEVAKSEIIVKTLKDLGYRVGFNIMQIATKSSAEIEEAVKIVSSWNTAEVLYFADSLGNMNEGMVGEVMATIKKDWSGEIGIHAHNNKGQALSNTMYSKENGATWLDATILGMGRGAGNTKMEHLIIELERMGHDKYVPAVVFPLVMKHFRPMQEKYEWGESLYYYLAANYEIHPSFVQQMVSCGQYESQQIFNALASLKSIPSTSFKNDLLKDAVISGNQSIEGSWSPSSWPEGRDILILANGEGLKTHTDAVKRYIKKNNPTVISLNTNKYIEPELITAYAVCTEARLLLEYQKYSSFKKPIIMPLNEMPKQIIEKLNDIEILNYGRVIESGAFESHEFGCKIPYSLVAPYVFSIAIRSSASRILLAGFDGFGVGDVRQKEMDDVFELYEKVDSKISITSLTPSYYQIKQSSIYSPEI